MLEHHQASELVEWSAGFGKHHDIIVLEFHGSKPWILLAPSMETVKAIMTAIWDVVGVTNRRVDSLPFRRNMFNFGKAIRCSMRSLKLHFNVVSKLVK